MPNTKPIWTFPQTTWSDPGTPASGDYMQARDQDIAFLFQMIGAVQSGSTLTVSTPGDGVFTPTKSGSAIIYLIGAGGGGGGATHDGSIATTFPGSGGGAGGLVIFQTFLIGSTPYSYHVGNAGILGADRTGDPPPPFGLTGGTGENTWFSATSNKGGGGVGGGGGETGIGPGAGGTNSAPSPILNLTGNPGVLTVGGQQVLTAYAAYGYGGHGSNFGSGGTAGANGLLVILY